YIFGSLNGFFYSYLGIIIGSCVAFLIARRFGRPFIEKSIRKEKIAKFDYTVNSRDDYEIFLLFLIPWLPVNIFCYLAGLTKIKFEKFLIIIMLARLPYILISCFIGGQFGDINLIEIISLAILIFIIVTIVFLKSRKKKNQLNW
ncbi:MAG: VTT domain-containing protein, partial [archaeon]